MHKDKILFGTGGLLLGLVIGFLFANNINRSASVGDDAIQPSSSSDISPNAGLPPNHPPLQDGGSQGSLPEVTAAIEKARSEPANFEAQMTAGDLYYQIQRFDEALKFYENANRLRPAETEPSVKIGNTHFDAERYEEAERWYAGVLKKDPNDVNVRADLGLTFFLRTPRDVDRAIKEFNTALSIEPDNEIALQNLALALIEKKDTDNLQKTLDKLAAVNPNNPVVVKQRPK